MYCLPQMILATPRPQLNYYSHMRIPEFSIQATCLVSGGGYFGRRDAYSACI